MNGEAWLLIWCDRAGKRKSGRADSAESLLRLVAHALGEQGHAVPALLTTAPAPDGEPVPQRRAIHPGRPA